MGKAFSIVFWDVGQGDCSTIHLPNGKIIIIDTGPKGSPLIDWLNERDRKQKIHAIAITHNDADHNGSLPALLEALEGSIERIYMLFHKNDCTVTSRRLFRKLFVAEEAGKIKIERLETGATLWSDQALQMSLEVVHPRFLENVVASTRNLSSGILSLQRCGKTEVIWPGDVSLSLLNKHCAGTSPHYLVGPHHGAPEGCRTAEGLLAIERVAPENVFISVGTGNRYSHPRPKYVRLLERSGCNVQCSQITTHCDRSQVLEKKKPLMQSHAYWGLRPPRSGLACRGTKMLFLQEDNIVSDELEEEFQNKILKLRRPQCLKGRGERGLFRK